MREKNKAENGCPCYNCPDRLSEMCDHGVKCEHGFATWKFWQEYKRMKEKSLKEKYPFHKYKRAKMK